MLVVSLSHSLEVKRSSHLLNTVEFRVSRECQLQLISTVCCQFKVTSCMVIVVTSRRFSLCRWVSIHHSWKFSCSRDLIFSCNSQLLNFDVDAINSVQLSNHTGYKTIKGQILSEADLADLFEGLTANNLHLTYSHLLTGYVGNDKFLREISRIIKHLRQSNPNVIYGKEMIYCSMFDLNLDLALIWIAQWF